jgi:hypothetical protein
VLVFEDGQPVSWEFVANETLRTAFPTFYKDCNFACIEMIASYGLPVGAEVFETCLWIGRLQERMLLGYLDAKLIYRKDVKLHLCGTPRAKDANIRQALIDRYGGKTKAIGNKKTPGPLYGIKSHGWAALALAVTYYDTLTP